jgi:hypothetical protein
MNKADRVVGTAIAEEKAIWLVVVPHERTEEATTGDLPVMPVAIGDDYAIQILPSR